MTFAQVNRRLKYVEAELKAIRAATLQIAAEKRLLAAVKILRADCVRRNGAEP